MKFTKFLDAAATLNSQLTQPIAIVGSLALAIRGITDVQPNDLDVIVSKADFERLFGKDHQLLVCKSGKLRSYYQKLDVAGLQVEVMASVETLCGNQWNAFHAVRTREYWRHGDNILGFVNLQDLIDFYCALGRDKDFEKIRLINNHLSSVSHVDVRKNPDTHYRKAVELAFRRLFSQCKVD